MIRSLFCTVVLGGAMLLSGLHSPVLAEEAPDLAAIRARQLYFDGQPDAAFAAIKPLAEQGVPRAEVILGFFYETGVGTAPDAALALQWYEKAAAQNQPAALHNLAYSYENGELGLTKDLAKAYALYLRAVALEYPPSIHNLARMYIYGEGAPQDASLGRALIERAATLGLADATADYAYMLATGDGLPADLPRARELYFVAGAQGVDWAQRDYGEMLELGQGGPIDLSGAEEWYLKAQGQGYVKAGYDIAEMLWANAAALPDRQVDALAWCYWAEANGPDADGTDYTGKCAGPAAQFAPADVTRAQELATTF